MDNSSSPSNHPYCDPEFWIMWIVVIAIIILGGIKKCQAATKEITQYDTIPAHVEYVVKFIQKDHTTAKGNTTTRYYAVYADKQLGINDIIPLSEAVFTYIHECSDFGVAPQLGIKLKNGEIYSLIRIRKKIKHGR